MAYSPLVSQFQGRSLCAILLLLWISLKGTTACSPPLDWPPSFDESYESAASIFTGTVTSIENYENEFDQGFCVNVTLKVLDKWKGSPATGQSVTVSTASNDGLCGFGFQQSETYLVWTSSPISLCGTNEQVDILGRTNVIASSQAQSDVELLVEKRTMETDSCSFTKRCCVEDCCGENTSWDAALNKCVSDAGSGGWTGYTPPFGDDLQCLPQYPCCEEECCGFGTSFDASIAYCVISPVP